ncbi:VRR-NUC domain-containing protein [Shinella sp. DD12]|uniref:VRR-NUC domain-containing protein n=1 Tax=Shinella sp. DD12 TaxID=1410620 RepID=UPI0003C54625|nr:VRR-NUC domain-containing protein [Shinella sp. DD12]EYR81839.1 hypothetical protein SHLA_4c001300 [Shinella sp. DD12]
MARSTTKQTQTTRINGKRVRIVTTDGKVAIQAAPPLESDLQAAQVVALRRMPEHRDRFVIAGDMNAERRGPKARAIALATGMASGEPDLRVYAERGRLLLIENKVGNPATGGGGKLSPAQKLRHDDLGRLGYRVEVVRSMTPEDAAQRAVSLVREWLAANDNHREEKP